MSERGPRFSWRKYDNWYHGLSRETRHMGQVQGQWPEGTPQVYIDLISRVTSEEILLNTIFGEKKLTIEEALARPADYLQTRDTKPPGSHQLLKEQVEGVIMSLTARERRVLKLRHGLDDGHARTQAEVGEIISRSPRTVRRIEREYWQKLRHPSRPDKLKDYLE